MKKSVRWRTTVNCFNWRPATFCIAEASRPSFSTWIVQGRLKHTIQHPHGNDVIQKYLGRGSQFGAIAAAQVDPVPITVVAVEPSSMLRLDYDKYLQYVAKFPRLLVNFIRDVGTAFKQTFSLDRIHSQPKMVMVVHASAASRPLTKRLIDRLQDLGEQPCVLTDDPSWEARSDVPQLLAGSGRQLAR